MALKPQTPHNYVDYSSRGTHDSHHNKLLGGHSKSHHNITNMHTYAHPQHMNVVKHMKVVNHLIYV